MQSNFTCCHVRSINGLAILKTFLIKFLQYLTKPRKAQTCLGILGGCMFWIACVFEGNGQMPLVLRMCPKYCISFVKKWHLLNFMESLAVYNFSKTCLMWESCSSTVVLKIMISSKYAMAKSKSFKMPVMSSWKYAGAFASPKGTLTYSYLPNDKLNAVLGMEDLSRGIWW